MLDVLKQIINSHSDEVFCNRAKEMLERVQKGEREVRWDNIEWQIKMKIIVNGEMRFYRQGLMLKEVLDNLRIDSDKVELNSEVIQREQYAGVALKENDCIEITAEL